MRTTISNRCKTSGSDQDSVHVLAANDTDNNPVKIRAAHRRANRLTASSSKRNRI